MSETKKIIIGVLGGVLGIAVLFTLVLMLVGKGDEPVSCLQPILAQEPVPVPPDPAQVQVRSQALLAEKPQTEAGAVSSAGRTTQDPGKASTSTSDAQAPRNPRPTRMLAWLCTEGSCLQHANRTQPYARRTPRVALSGQPSPLRRHSLRHHCYRHSHLRRPEGRCLPLQRIGQESLPAERKMTMFTTLFLLALTTQTPAPKPPISEIRVKYDKFDDQTVISTNLGKIPGCDAKKSDIMLIVSHEGRNAKKFTDAMLLVVLSRSDEDFAWKDDTIHEVQMMCGDDHIPIFNLSGAPPYARYESKTYGATCTETFFVDLNLRKSKEFLKTNKDWEVRIDFDDPFVLGAKHRAKMLSFIRFLEEGGG